MTIPEQCTAIEITTPGGPDVLRPVRRATPTPGPGDVLVRVAAAGVNRPDLNQRAGNYPPPRGASDIPGLEIAGIVVAAGAEVTRWTEGDMVCALVSGGGYAEYCVAPAPQCLPVPPGMSAIDAAALPETFFTVWNNLFQRGRLKPGESVLVHGGTSGIGTTATQLAQAFGARVYATAGSDEKCAACERLGATAINYRATDFAVVIRELTGGLGVDAILDIIGASYLQRNLDSLAVDGRLIQIGLQGGARAEINLAQVLQRRLTIVGSTLRPRSVAEKGAIAVDLEAKVWPLLASGEVKPIVARVLPLIDAAEAHRLLESGAIVGKIVLTTSSL